MKSFIKTVLGGALAAVGLVQVAVFSTAMLAGTAMAQNSPPTLNGTKEVVRSLTGTTFLHQGLVPQREGSATFARFEFTTGIATAPDGRIFVTDLFNGGRVAVLNAAGDTVSTYSALGGTPGDIVRAPDGRIFVSLSVANRIVVISSDGNTVSTYAGSSTGAAGYADGSTVTARFSSPRGLALAADGRLFVADSFNSRIRVISADGATVSTYAGNGFFTNVDGSTATASFDFITDIAWVPDGRLFVAEIIDATIRVIDANGSTVSTYAGGGTAPAGFTEAPIEQARFNQIDGMTALADGRVFVLSALSASLTDARIIYEINAAGSTVTLYAGDPDGQLGPVSPIDGDALETEFRVFNAAHAAANGTDLLVATNGSQGLLRIIETVAVPVDLSTSLTTFSQQRATAVVFDSTTIQGAFIDADADVLSYSIVSSTPSADLFTINASSGLIRMARTPDDDESSTHTLIIAASDSSASVATTATVVLSPFNHPPVVVLATTTISVAEDFNSFSVGLITASNDGDNDGTTQTISYSIDPAAVAFATVSIAAQSGTLTLSAIADAFGTATLTVTATDSGTENTQSTTEVLLVVSAVNDAPSFTLSTAALSLAEDFGSTQVTVISSDDGDATVVQPLSYAISTTSIGFANLVIDADSGTLTLSSVPNQFGSTVTVTITLDDGQNENNLATQTLLVAALDVNTPPIFTLNITNTLSLSEDFGDISVIVSSSNDGDEDGIETPLTFSVSTTDVGFATLSIDSQSGEVTIVALTNGFGVATVGVAADDGAENGRSTQSFVLSVVSVNDPPEFNLSAATLVVDEDFGRVSVTVTDSNDGDDLATAQVLSYSISTENIGFATLSIDAQSGVVTIDSVADGFGVATVYVVADDSSSANNFSTQSFVLTVNAVNDAPNFALSAAALSLAEDFGSTQVTVVSSDDGDIDGVTQTLSYSLSTSHVGFATLSVDGSGTVSISSVADGFGVATVYVVADDSSAANNFSTQSFVLTVNAVNDAPSFALSAAAVVLDEDFTTTQAISVVSSDDGDDDGVSQPLTYSLSTSHVGFATLSVDGSGTVSISSVANGFGVATVEVTLTDDGLVDTLSTQSFVLTVNNINDAPNFALSTTALVLDEDFGSTQVTVASSDDGDGTSQSLSYSISTTAVGFATLSIDGSGTVSISSVADGFGVATVYVVADDSSAANNLSTQSFVLTVNNVNDAPNFALSTAALILAEDFGSTQVTVASSDDGDGTSQSLSYSLSTSHVGFATLSVDGSGTVSINGVADAFGVATVTVTADDGGAVDSRSTQSFVLTVNAVNDAPSFTLSTAALSLAEDFGSTQVTVISSDDGDATEDQLSVL